VLGREGVGRGTVSAALARAGVTVTSDATAADVHVLVIAEALKPEDRGQLAAADRPIVTLLNKADLAGLGDDAAAHLRRAVHWRRYSRGPVDALHRSCGADIARGSLRLLGRTR
jgi:hypothetical protein